jgi:hypothetical protein
MAFLSGIMGGEKGLNNLPGYFLSNDPRSEAQDVHIIVFNPLVG